ncbi:hypothetical protein ACU4GD_18725 [Cupriavidus basilensis]
MANHQRASRVPAPATVAGASRALPRAASRRRAQRIVLASACAIKGEAAWGPEGRIELVDEGRQARAAYPVQVTLGMTRRTLRDGLAAGGRQWPCVSGATT